MPAPSRTPFAPTALAIMALAAAVPADLHAQDTVPVAEAAAFIGDWVLPLQSDFGEFEMTLQIADSDGSVVAAIGMPQGSQAAESVSKSGDDLVLGYSVDTQGQAMAVSLTLRPDGENLAATVDIADGAYIASGMAHPAD